MLHRQLLMHTLVQAVMYLGCRGIAVPCTVACLFRRDIASGWPGDPGQGGSNLGVLYWSRRLLRLLAKHTAPLVLSREGRSGCAPFLDNRCWGSSRGKRCLDLRFCGFPDKVKHNHA
mmetsp:Transcript_37133/g.119681  ORF Transcript_37133/g.119681 Transcript_37133/m.119681 type:complete len:117 (+) Transcript_37133:198-548(+)